MKYSYIWLVLIITTNVFALDASLIEGKWENGGGVFLGFDFIIANGKITFPDRNCLNNEIEIIEMFEAKIKGQFGKLDNYYSYIIKIKFSNLPNCVNTKAMTGEYIRMSIPTNYICHSSTYFYDSIDELNVDKINNWDGKSASGWAGYGYLSEDRKCD